MSFDGLKDSTCEESLASWYTRFPWLVIMGETPGNALVNSKDMVDSSNTIHFPEKQDVLPLGKTCINMPQERLFSCKEAN